MHGQIHLRVDKHLLTLSFVPPRFYIGVLSFASLLGKTKKKQ